MPLNEKKLCKILPIYSILPLIFFLVIMVVAYALTKFIDIGMEIRDFTNDFDRAVPFISQFMYIYVATFPFWLLSYLYVANKTDKQNTYRMMTSCYVGIFIAMIFFIFMPTTIVRPEVTGNLLSEMLSRLVFAADTPYNLFPSLHCMVSVLCFASIRTRKDISKTIKIISLISVILICASTQLVKQHYIVDAIGGIFIAEITVIVINATKADLYVGRFFEKLDSIIFRRALRKGE